ncbi:MAG: DUF1028 domain-containing protein [Myxococcales bacterium]|nr:DUF1028 domain-containing protein [Myxococcales bacterium]
MTRSVSLLSTLSLLCVLCVPLSLCAREAQARERRVHTYSIVARDAKTGALGVAVHSHWFQVGRLVAWAEAGVGAIATQAMTNASFGPRGLALLRRGLSAKVVLQKLLASDKLRHNRQLAIVDARGGVAAWTGKRCIPDAGHQIGSGFSTQANLMASKRVWPAMARAYRQARGPLAERLLAALRAAEKAGGDLRGRQSAALLVVPGKRAKIPALAPLVDLRVADHRQPLDELARLLRIRRAYDAWGRGAAALESRKLGRARRAFAEMNRLLPARQALRFWQAHALYRAGRVREGIALFRAVFAKAPRWRRVLPRLVGGKLLSAAQLADIRRRLRGKSK